MWLMLKNLIAQGEDEGWRRFLPFIILMVLYGLSSLFKNKAKKNPPARRPDPEVAKPPVTIKRAPRLPSYARKQATTASKSQPTQASRPAGQPHTSPTPARPVPMSRPVERPVGEAMESPRPKPRAQRPATPQAEVPEPVRRTAPSSVKPATQTARHIQAEKKPRTTGQRPKPSRTSKSAKTAVRALHSRHQHVSEPVVVESLTATERLVERTSRKGALSQAILYGEILGTPMSLRPAGSHSYAALGSSGSR